MNMAGNNKKYKNNNNFSQLVQVTAEPHVPTEDARQSAMIVEEELHQQLHQQSLDLERFRKRVKERLRKQKHEKLTDKDSIIIQKHIDPRTSRTSDGGPINNDNHDVKIINCNEDRTEGIRKILSLQNEEPMINIEPSIPLRQVHYKEPLLHTIKPVDHSFKVKSGTAITIKPVQTLSENEQKMLQKKEVAAHNLVVRRIYSALERQQTKVNAQNKLRHEAAMKRKELRERERRKTELQYEQSDEEDEIDKEKAIEWMEMIALQRRHQLLTKQKEMERYCEALKFQLREKHFNVPPLCKCHPSIWDANPSQCARNCPFYNNHAKFAKELSSLFQSISN